MSRKHFVAIAATIKEIANSEERTRAAKALASTFAQFNAQFDRERFLIACGAV